MVDKETMAAYAANIEKFRDMVTKIGGNSRLDGFLARLPKGAAILDPVSYTHLTLPTS